MTNDPALRLGELPYATAKSLRILGKIRQHPEDFQVDEVPIYLPSGRGDHLFVHFRKRELNTQQAAKAIARGLGVNPSDASWAGMKDRYAVTTQWASFRGGDAARARALQLPGIEILEAALHPHKLRTGHLRANRFRLRMVCEPSALATVEQIAETLTEHGMPNYYGEQRFGGDNLTAARAFVLEGGRPPRDRFKRKLLVSCLQSAVFNDWLAERLSADLFARPIEGDLMRREDSGGLFCTTDLATEAERMRRWEISPTGPIYGSRMPRSAAEADLREQALFERWRLEPDRFAALGKLARGTRRPARVALRGFCVEAEPDRAALQLSFELPPGAYATVLIREFLKPGAHEIAH